PEELEDYISGIEGVKEVLVYSKKDEKGIESGLTAIVYPDEEAKLTEDEIKHHITAVLSHLPVYKQIQNVVLRNEPFEKTTTNKIKRQNYIN
ncbi:MAG: AMP-dependent synthetase, partial [Clostridia bacterium]|nr:AMP-dependent synthetase [Clostridia bacterium]